MTYSPSSLPATLPSRRLLVARTVAGLLAAAVTLPAAALATEWHAGLASSPQAGSAREAAESHLQHTAALRLRDTDFAFRGELRARSYRTERFDQQYAGIPVLDRSAAVRVAPDGTVRVVVLDVERGLAVDPTPRVPIDDARRFVATHFGGSAEQARATLAILPNRGGSPRLVWAVDRPSSRGGYRAFVDAHDGSVLGRVAIGKTALGRVYEISAVNTPEPIDAELVDLDASSPQYLNGWAGQLRVTNYVSGDSLSGNYVAEQTLEPSAGEDFLYDPPPDATDELDPFAQVNLYYHLTRMRDYFSTTHGLDMTAPSWRMVAVANVLDDGNPYDNAFYSPVGPAAPFDAPNMIGVGQGAMFDYSDDSDVFLHEFTHFVNHNAVGYNNEMFTADEWGLNVMAGGIDEGVADYMACTVNGDPVLGEASLGRIGAARDLTAGNKVCPDDITGEPHMDGEIIGNVTWALRGALGTETADDLVWGAVTLLTPGVTLGDFGTALLQTADDFIAEGTLTSDDRATIEAALVARGLDDCGHEVTVSPDNPRQTFMFGLNVIGQYVGMTCAQLSGFVELQSLFHYVTMPAADDQGIRLRVQLVTSGSGTLDWAIYARRNEHVGFSTAGMMPSVADFDYVSERFSEQQGELVIDPSSDPPFDPTASYHFVVVHKNCASAQADVSVEPVGTGGAGGGGVGGAGGVAPEPAAPAEEDSGCSCRLAAGSQTDGSGTRSGSNAGWLAALLPLAWVTRRRRPRSVEA